MFLIQLSVNIKKKSTIAESATRIIPTQTKKSSTVFSRLDTVLILPHLTRAPRKYPRYPIFEEAPIL